MLVREIMSSPAVTIATDAPLDLAVALLHQHSVTMLPVDELMTSAPITITADTDLAVTADLMTSTGLKSLPVIDDQRNVVGVVSRRDIVRVLARTDLDVEAELDNLFHRVGAEWMVEVVQGGVTITGPSGPRQRAMAKALADSVPGVRSVSVRTDQGVPPCP